MDPPARFHDEDPFLVSPDCQTQTSSSAITERSPQSSPEAVEEDSDSRTSSFLPQRFRLPFIFDASLVSSDLTSPFQSQFFWGCKCGFVILLGITIGCLITVSVLLAVRRSGGGSSVELPALATEGPTQNPTPLEPLQPPIDDDIWLDDDSILAPRTAVPSQAPLARGVATGTPTALRTTNLPSASSPADESMLLPTFWPSDPLRTSAPMKEASTSTTLRPTRSVVGVEVPISPPSILSPTSSPTDDIGGPTAPANFPTDNVDQPTKRPRSPQPTQFPTVPPRTVLPTAVPTDPPATLQPTKFPTVSPRTLRPTATPADVVDDRIDTVANFVIERSMLDAPLRYSKSADPVLDNLTPEEQALHWILHVDPLRSDTKEGGADLLQRYALLTLWFQQPRPPFTRSAANKKQYWTSEAGWATSAHVCVWDHIKCNGPRQTVVELQMEEIQLAGTLSPEVALLSDLRTMNLEGNLMLRGRIPSSIGQGLTQLTFLDLGPNSFSGTIPTTFGLLTALTFISVNRCPLLEGTIPTELARLTNLEVASFFGTDLTGTMPLCEIVTGGNLERLTADCDQVKCLCCSTCCPGERYGIPGFVTEPCE